jgi:hypothetical protein
VTGKYTLASRTLLSLILYMAHILPRQKLFARTRPKLNALLESLHNQSLEQERQAGRPGQFFPRPNTDGSGQGDKFFKDKLVALEEDKASSMYLILRAMGAKRIFEGERHHGHSLALSFCF